MKRPIVLAFIAANVLAAPVPALAVPSELAMLACDGVVPETWRRPGGYCEQEESTKSLSGPVDGCIILLGWNGASQRGARVDLAALDPCAVEDDPCATLFETHLPVMPAGDRIHMAC